MGRFEKITPTGGAVAYQYYYNNASVETQRDNLITGVNQIYWRDALNRMSRRDVKKGANPPLSYEVYGYNAMTAAAAP